VLRSGSWDLSSKAGDHVGQRLLRLWLRLEKFQSHVGHVDLLVYEQPGLLHGHARKVLPAMQGVVELWCAKEKIECQVVGVQAIKIHATGKGKANKDDMIMAAVARWPEIQIESHDHADALWLLDLVRSKFAGGDDRR